MKYCVLAYYVIHKVSDPERLAEKHRAFLATLDSCGRIYVSCEGINAQLSLAENDVEAYLDYLKQDSFYDTADIKIHYWHEHAFAKLAVKVRSQLCAIDTEVDFSHRGEEISPTEWRNRLENRDKNTILLDVRNNYESAVGHFEGAICPDLESFREFPQFAKELKKKFDPKKTTVLMFCTGGIRCEYFAPLMKQEGFEKVYQLKGGVIRYGLEQGNHLWHGKLFVFDDRLVVDIAQQKNQDISHCHFCKKPTSTYYNCANMDCNELFLACRGCAQAHAGCCTDKCQKEGRTRPFDAEERPKPFRRLPHEEKVKLSQH